MQGERSSETFATSTHTGHHWRSPTYFPSSNFQSVLNDPIPTSLNTKDQVLPEVHFQTTTGTYHDNKFPNQDIYNEPLALRNIKALPSYKVNYMYNVVETLNSKPRRPLTMAFQKSEYKNEFEDLDNEAAFLYERPIHRDHYLLQDDHKAEKTQIAFDGEYKTSVPPPKPIDPTQVGVLNLLDPYMTTYNKEHKLMWNKKQLKPAAKNDAITIYNDANMQKADYLNKAQNLSYDMRDPLWFKSDVKSRQVHKPLKPVPFSGALSETKQMFVAPSDVKAKQSHLCPVDTPFVQPGCSTKTTYATNEMYKSEYTNVGRGERGFTN